MTRRTAKAVRGRRRGGWRWLRLGVAALGVAGLALGFSVWLVTRSWFLVDRVTPLLEQRVGADVLVAGASYDGGGRVTLRDLRIHSRTLDGPAAEIARIGRAEVTLSIGALLRGRVDILAFELEDVHVRISESRRESGEFNFMTLAPQPIADTDAPPRIHLSQAVFEVGVHEGASYEALGARTVTGLLDPVADEDGWFDVQLVEVDPRGEVLVDGGFVLRGRWNARTNEQQFRLNELTLNDRTAAMCPQIVRLWWDRMQLSGRVAAAELQLDADGTFAVDFDVDDVSLVLPLETEDLWARYQDGRIQPSAGRPHMRVRKGRIRLGSDRLVLEKLEGELIAEGSDARVPYRVTVSIGDLPELDWDQREEWMDEVIRLAPFEMRFAADEFVVQRGPDAPAPAVELPSSVARVLERFHLTAWVLSTSVTIERGEPVRDPSGALAPAPIASRGQAYITEAAGAFEKFPYPLHDLQAYLEFNNNEVTVHYVTGSGPGDGTVRLSGTIAPLGRHAGIDLRLNARNMSVDQHLRDALLRERHRRVIDSLLHQASYRALRSSGLLPTEETIEAARVRRREVAAQRQKLVDLPQPTDEERQRFEELDAEMNRLGALIEAGAFELGGTVDLELDLHRQPGQGERTSVTGLVHVHRVGLLYEHFPYPIVITGGTFDWGEHRVTALGAQGVPIVTAGGGRGWISGDLELDRREGVIVGRPAIRLAIDNDRVNDLVYAAIPPRASRAADAIERGWPGGLLSEGGQWLHDLALDGRLRALADVFVGDDGRLDFAATVDLQRGSAQPASTIASLLAAGGLLRTTDWGLSDCRARLHATRREVTLESFEARHRYGRVEIEGRIDTAADPAEQTFDVQLEDMELGRYLIDLLPAERVEQVQALWSQLQPEGRFSARLHHFRRGDEADPLVLRVQPEQVRVRIDDQPVTLTRTAGQLRITPERVWIDDLALQVHCGERDDGVIALAGAYGVRADAEEEGLAVNGRWQGGHFESPLVPDVLRRFGAARQAERYQTFEPGGTFNATFRYASAAGEGRPDYSVHVEPLTLNFRDGDASFFGTLDPGARISFLPERIELRDIACSTVGGQFRVNGDVDPGDPFLAELAVEYDGRIRTGQATIFLPEIVRDVFNAIELEEGEPSRLREGVLVVTRDGDEERVTFTGRVETQDASFRTGLSFTEVSGPFDLSVAHETGHPPRLDVRARPDHVRLLGQTLTATDARITLSPDGRRVLVRDGRSSARDGAVTVDATVGLAEHDEYTLAVRLAGVPLGDFLIRDPKAPAPAEPRPEDPERPTGNVFARLDLRGRRGEPAERCGSGVIRVLEGRLGRVPIALQAFSLLQLTLPGSGLDYGGAEFYVTGDRLILERIVFESTFDQAALQKLTGEGEMNTDTFELDARFQSRTGWLGLRDLVGGIGDRLATIEITGPIWDPTARLLPLATLDDDVQRTVAAPAREDPAP